MFFLLYITNEHNLYNIKIFKRYTWINFKDLLLFVPGKSGREVWG